MIEKLITNIDFLSPEPKLRIYSKTRFKSLLGGIFSILSGLTVSALAMYFVFLTFYRTQFLVIFNQMQNPFPSYDLFANPILFSLVDKYAINYADPQRLFEYRAIYNFFNPNSSKMEFLPLKIDLNCKENYGKYWPNWKGLLKVKQDFSCLIPEDGKAIFGNYGDPGGFSFFSFYVNKCTNNTIIGKKDCFSNDVIEDTLKETYLNFGVVDY